MSSTEVVVIEPPQPVHSAPIQLESLILDPQVDHAAIVDAEAGGETESQPPLPIFKILVSGYSFFCAGLDSATLGPLVPHLLASFSIGTGHIAIM